MPELTLPPLSQPLLKVEKRADEEIKYTLNLSNTLDKNEVIMSIIKVAYPVPITLYRSRRGNTIEITVPPTTITGSFACREDRLLVEYKTILGNTRSLEFIVKVYK